MTFLDALRRAVPGVATGEAERAAGSVDRSGVLPDGLPLAVVRPRDVAEVRATLRLAHEHGVAVVPRGGGSGVAGERWPGPGRWCWT